ncbi:hypothetical protein GCM10009678_14860 [Actinomadura kijaniata]
MTPAEPISHCPPAPGTGSSRTISNPGADAGTSSTGRPVLAGGAPEVRARTRARSARPAPVTNHLRPWTVQVPPAFRPARVAVRAGVGAGGVGFGHRVAQGHLPGGDPSRWRSRTAGRA